MFGIGKKKKTEEELTESIFYDLTNLEINTIIKDDMTASKASSSARLLLHNIAGTYAKKLISLGEKYAPLLSPEVVIATRNSNSIPPDWLKRMEKEGQSEPDYETLFRGVGVYDGSGYQAFRELSYRAEQAFELLKKQKGNITLLLPTEIGSDMMMLKRIQSISDNLRNLLKRIGDVSSMDKIKHNDPNSLGEPLDFDYHENVVKFREMTIKESKKSELKIDLRQLMVIKKANDIGTEQVVMQTIIGMDGDITTRISRSFANQPITFVNDLHKDAMSISVDYWKFLIKIVVDLGKSIAKI